MDYQFQRVKSLGRGPNKPLLELLDKQDDMKRAINGHFREERISSKSSLLTFWNCLLVVLTTKTKVKTIIHITSIDWVL